MNKRYRVELVQNLEYFVNNLDENDRIISVVTMNVPYRDMGEIEHSWITKAIIERVNNDHE